MFNATIQVHVRGSGGDELKMERMEAYGEGPTPEDAVCDAMGRIFNSGIILRAIEKGGRKNEQE